MRRVLHYRQVVDALDPGGGLDRRNEAMDGRTELGQLLRSHVAEVQKMPPGLQDDRSCAGLLQRGALGGEELALDDVAAPWAGHVQKLRPRFHIVLLLADIAVRTVVIRRRADFHRSLAGWSLPRSVGHLYLHLSPQRPG